MEIQLGSAKLFEALSKAQGEFKAPPKDCTAKIGTYSFKYSDLATIIETVRPVLVKFGLCVTQTIQNAGSIQFLVTRLGHASGDCVESWIELPKTPDMKTLGGNLTYLRRYSLCAILGIAAEDDSDYLRTEEPRSTPPVNAPKPPVRPESSLMNPQTPTPPKLVTQPQLARLMAIANKQGWTEANVNFAIKTMFNLDSKTALSVAQYDKLIAEIQQNRVAHVDNADAAFGNQNELR